MDAAFGDLLKSFRLRAGIGLRRFAELIDIQPSNLSNVEHGRRRPPGDPARLREFANALGLVEGSEDWAAFFDAACRPGALPSDVQHLSKRKLVPALLRTIDNHRLSDTEIKELISDIQSRHGGADDADT